MPPPCSPIAYPSVFAKLFCTILLLSTCRAQQQGAAKLNTTGIPDMDAFTFQSIFAGNEDKIAPLIADSRYLKAPVILDGYLTAYGLLCSQFLPDDKVEWTLPRCDERRETSAGSFECVRQGETHTHVFVDKNIYQLKNEVSSLLVARQMSGSLQDSFNRIGDLVSALNDPNIRASYASDWVSAGKLVVVNGCLSPELRRFQDNLIRLFRHGVPLLTSAYPMEIPSAKPPLQSPPLSNGLPPLPRSNNTKKDYARLIEDTQREQNPLSQVVKIKPGSVKSVQILRKDDFGRPVLLSATFDVSGEDYGKQWMLYYRFSEGRPYCYTLVSAGTPFDAKGPCGMTPSHDTQMKFETGGYDLSEESGASNRP